MLKEGVDTSVCHVTLGAFFFFFFFFFVGHIRAHSGLPGLLSEGNNVVDRATQVVASALTTTPLAAAQ